MLRPVSGAQASAYFDDVAFDLTTPPPEPPARTATPRPSATTSPDSATPSPSPAAEPQLFSSLTNGSFEDVREDGTPYGWRKVGGEIAATDTASVAGELAQQFVSRTSSTKWAYQAVTDEAGRVYELAGFAAIGDGDPEAFLRVSWYRSLDATGPAIATEDSPSASPATAAFQRLTTGPIEAPAGAGSAKLRLMLRPPGATTAIAYFDALSFGESTAPAEDTGSATLPAATANREVDSSPLPLVLGAVSGAIPHIANVTPAPRQAVTQATAGDNTLLWFLGSLAVPLLVLTAIGAVELSRRPGAADR